MAAGDAPPEAGDGNEGAGMPDAGAPFVINLCSSTTPMALAHPDSPELKRFSFFVSRRREDNRERFRLHMGYFNSLAEAEEWLNVVRDVYPGAWAGEAPGKKLRARAAATAAGQLPDAPPVAARAKAAAPAVSAPATRPAAPSVAAPSAPRPSASMPANLVVPTLQAAPAPAPVDLSASARLMAPALASMPRPPVAPQKPVASSQAATAPASAPPPRAPAAQPGPPVAARPAAKPAVPNVLTHGSNVREVLAALDETNETRHMPMPAGLRAPAPAARAASTSPRPAAAMPGGPVQGGAVARAPSAPSARGAAPAAAKPRPSAPAARVPAVEPPAQPSASLTDTQVLRMLETRRSEDGERGSDDANSGISLLKPDDTQTRRALKEAVVENAPVSFAVQLQWSVRPVELDKVPPLAIFSAYTLYTVEGSREGRKWYGLRLGFFSDAISAKQVAYYVRSEFTSVAVVPVSPQERSRASDEEAKAATGAFQRKAIERKSEEFKLFDDDASALSEPAPPPPPVAEKPAVPAEKRGPVRKNKPLGRVRAKEQRSAKTLEETLEILGASELEIDRGTGETLNDTGVRHLRVEVQKNTPFAKLLDRLSERVRKN